MQQVQTIHRVSEKNPLERLTQYSGYIAAGVTVLLWASAFAGIRAGLRDYSPTSLALLRYIVASLALLIYAIATRMPLPHWRDVPGIMATGFIGFTVYNVALNAGEQKIEAGVASAIVASGPIYTAIIASIWFKEKLNRRGWFGIMVSFGGVMLITLVGQGSKFSLDWHALLVLTAAVMQALYFVGQKPFLRTYGPLRFATYAIWAGTLFLLIFTPDLIQEAQHASPEGTLAVVYMGIFPGTVAYVCWSLVLSKFPAPIAASFLYLVPAVAVLIAWGWLGERPNAILLIGGMIIVMGVVTVNRQRRVAVSPKPA
jgi:drug/metabolite transporter (DMT)-like permease